MNNNPYESGTKKINVPKDIKIKTSKPAKGSIASLKPAAQPAKSSAPAPAKAIKAPAKPKVPDAKRQRTRKIIFFVLSIVVVLIIMGAAYLSNGSNSSYSYKEYYTEAADLFSKGDYAGAVPLLRKALDKSSTVDATLLLGECYARMGDYSKAAKALESFNGSDGQIIQKLNEYRNLDESLKNGETVTIGTKTVSINATGLALDGLGLTNEDLRPLTAMYSLSNLSVENNNITDLSVISELRGLTTLNVGNNYISDLSGLSNLSSLRILYLDNNPISDLSPVYSLSNLSTLSIKGVNISNQTKKSLSAALPGCAIHTNSAEEDAKGVTDISIGGYSFRSDVTELNLSNMGISDLSSLTACKSLQVLDISGNNISDLTPLMEIPTLSILYMSGNAVSDIRPLMGLTKLEIIDASFNRISSVAAFGSMAQLKQLNISDNEIYNVAPLRKLTALYALNVDNNMLTDDAFEYFYSIGSLQELSINGNPGVTAAGVNFYRTNSPMVNVHAETVSTTIRIGIYDYDSLSTEISASYMGLTSIQELSGFTNLQSLVLEHNSISNIYVLSLMPQTLINLDLSDNNISDITPISYQQNIETLDLSNNSISTLTPLYSLRNLRSLYINGNNVTDDEIGLLQMQLPGCAIYY